MLKEWEFCVELLAVQLTRTRIWGATHLEFRTTNPENRFFRHFYLFFLDFLFFQTPTFFRPFFKSGAIPKTGFYLLYAK